MQIAAREGPFKGTGSPRIVGLERQQTLFEFGQRREIIGREDLALDNRKVDLNLVEPTGVDGSVDENGVRPLGAKAVDGFLPAMSGAVVHDPEDAACGLVGLLAHDFAHETPHGGQTVLGFTTSKDLGAVDVPGGQVDPGALAKILVLNPGGAARSGRQSRLFAAPRLNTGLLVGGDDEVVNPQWGALPSASVKIEDGSGLVRKLRIAREDPASMLPGTQSIAAEPAPQCGAADLRD